MKAIIATDGSVAAQHAADAAELLLRDEIEFLLATVVPEPEDPLATAGGFEGPIIDEEEAEEWARRADEAGQEAIRRTAQHLDEPVSARLLHDDDPGEALCRLAEEQSADVLVLATSEKGALRRMLEGSVMAYVLKHAPCPVLVVPRAR